MTFIPLSSSPKGGLIDGVAAEPARTVIHTVPENRTHKLFVSVNNIHSSASVRVLGDLTGGEEDQTYVIDRTVASRTLGTLLDGLAVRGPCVLSLAAEANQSSVKVSGHAEVIIHL